MIPVRLKKVPQQFVAEDKSREKKQQRARKKLNGQSRKLPVKK